MPTRVISMVQNAGWSGGQLFRLLQKLQSIGPKESAAGEEDDLAEADSDEPMRRLSADVTPGAVPSVVESAKAGALAGARELPTDFIAIEEERVFEVDRNDAKYINVQVFAGVSISGFAHGGALKSPQLGELRLLKKGFVYVPHHDAAGLDVFHLVALADAGGEHRLFTFRIHVWKVFEQNLGAENEGVVVELEGINGTSSAVVQADGLATVYGLQEGKYAASTAKEGMVTVCNALTVDIGPKALTREAPPAPTKEVRTDGVRYEFYWKEDPSVDQYVQGCEYASHVLQPSEVLRTGEAVPAPSFHSSAATLAADFGIYLMKPTADVAGSVLWTSGVAYRLLEILRRLDLADAAALSELDGSRRESTWYLTSDFIAGDIIYDERRVLLSRHALAYAEPRITTLHNGRRGRYFSLRLHHAVLKWITDDGASRTSVELFEHRFGTSINWQTDTEKYTRVTSLTTREDRSSFQDFTPRERLILWAAFEEMPDGFHKIPNLDFLLRRRNGQQHPLHGNVPAVAWPFAGANYIEFMEAGFHAALDSPYLHGLIIHEKAHFMWEYSFDDTLKKKWIALSNWRLVGDEWHTDSQTTFFNAYAHQKNPNEDMAESVAAYVRRPEELKAKALAKYNFLRDNIMSGTRYLTHVRDDVTFTVLNLFSDYVFPGKIREINIVVTGAPSSPKVAEISISVHTLQSESQQIAGAAFRLLSPTGEHKDVICYPRPDEVTGKRPTTADTVVCRVSFSAKQRSGNWVPRQIILFDSAGNERYEKGNDYGWKLWIENPEEDTQPPRYVPGSARLSLERREIFNPLTAADEAVQAIVHTVHYEENVELEYCYAAIVLLPHNTIEAMGSFGTPTDEETCEGSLLMPEYMRSGTYEMGLLLLRDAALLSERVIFRYASEESAPSVELATSRPDSQPPSIDVAPGTVLVVAKTLSDSPNGSTEVAITFTGRDSGSGLRRVIWTLLDPQGRRSKIIHYTAPRRGPFPTVDPSAPAEAITVTGILPVGSPAGTWGIAEVRASDFANNYFLYDFTEIVQLHGEEVQYSMHEFDVNA